MEHPALGREEDDVVGGFVDPLHPALGKTVSPHPVLVSRQLTAVLYSIKEGEERLQLSHLAKENLIKIIHARNDLAMKHDKHEILLIMIDNSILLKSVDIYILGSLLS